MSAIFPLELTKNSQELRNLILDNPELPIVVVAGDGANDGDYSWMYCSSVSVGIEELLDCEVPYQEEVESDRDNFDERMEEWYWDKYISEFDTVEEDDFKTALAEEKAKYEPFWKKAIFIYANN